MIKRKSLILLALFAAISVYAGQSNKPKLPDGKNEISVSTSRDATTAKMSGELQALLQAFGPRPRGGGGPQVSIKDNLADIYGFAITDTSPILTIYCEGTGISDDQVKSAGGTVFSRTPKGVIVKIAMPRVKSLAQLSSIQTLSPLQTNHVPDPSRRKSAKGRGVGDVGEVGLKWDKQGMTGKGVVIGVLDTGIDYRHPDFIKPDGTSRIRALYDMSDQSFETSGGKIGTKPPLNKADGKPLGTLYTRDQLNAALKGKGTVNSVDNVGHGTACTSTAAGSGGYEPAAGVAPDADIIFVKAMVKSGKEEVFSADYPAAAQWVAAEAKKAGMPVVMNMSFGSQMNAHKGISADERILDGMVGTVPGVAICVSAGNEGREAFHAAGTFGPKRPGQKDVDAEPVELLVSDPLGSFVLGYFNTQDDWGMMLEPRQPIFTDKAGAKVDDVVFSIYKKEDKFSVSVKMLSGSAVPEGVLQQALALVHITKNENGEDRVMVDVPFGSYDVYGFGNTEKVTNGEYALYGPDYGSVSFGKGSSDENMVASPGNANNVITVGAYVARNTWKNASNQPVMFNILLGSTTNFSSPGPRRDGVIKPDISAPGQYIISALAKGSEMGTSGADYILPGGKYLAWMGTSASSPYCAGVVALMLQKNPKLTADQIKSILKSTATSDKLTRGTPNPYWGNGKLNPAAAIKAVTKG